MKNKKTILVSGLINQETNLNIHNFPIEYEPIIYAFNEITSEPSGVAYNILNALHTLEDSVIPVSIIGKDNIGENILNELNDLNITTDYIRKDLDTTCSSIILFDDSGKRKVYCDLKNIQDLKYPLSQIEHEIKNCDALILCNINFNDEIIKNCKKFNKPVFSDVHVLKDINDEYNKRFLENSDVVFLSDEGINGNYEDFLISIYNKYHNKIIVLGMGKQGAMILESQNRTVSFIESVFTRPVVNTVGAGDSLFSSFVHYYTQGIEPIDALKRSVVFASYKIGESGGAKGFPTHQQIESFIQTLDFKISTIKKF